MSSKITIFGLFALAGIYGLLVVYFTKKQKVKGNLGKLLILSGGSALAFPVFAILHNFLYALEIVSQGYLILSRLFGLLHGLSFIIATALAPIGFLIGTFGSLFIFVKKRLTVRKKK